MVEMLDARTKWHLRVNLLSGSWFAVLCSSICVYVCVYSGSARVCPMAMQIHLFRLFVVHIYFDYIRCRLWIEMWQQFIEKQTKILSFFFTLVGFASAALPFWENVIIFHFICVHQFFVFFLRNFSCFSSSRSTDLSTSCDVGQSRGEMSEHVLSFFVSILSCVLINLSQMTWPGDDKCAVVASHERWTSWR